MAKLGVKPRYIEVVRISPLTFRSIDVGVVLDVMIHDIDIVLSLAKSEVVDVQAHGVSVIGGGDIDHPAEDVCNARLTFADGCVASLTASRLAMRTERRLRVFAPDAYVSLDYAKKTGVSVRRTGNLEKLRDTVARIRSGEAGDAAGIDYKDLINIEQLTIDDVEPLRAQLESFIDAVEGTIPPVVPAAAGVAAVETAERIIAAMPDRTL
jgi:predicted dehydrogenase